MPGSTKTVRNRDVRGQFKQKIQEIAERKYCWFHLTGPEHERILGLNGGLLLVYIKKNLHFLHYCEFIREGNLGALTSFEHFLFLSFEQLHSFCLPTVSQKH